MRYSRVEFVKSVFKSGQLPPLKYPEIAFAGRSNVGKSSLMNRLLGRKNLVKTSSRPGKTQSLNYFLLDDSVYLVDLPGYGYARVSKKMKDAWGGLITLYMETRKTLMCVVVIIDLRHPLKNQDRDLVNWLGDRGIPCQPVYTKCDKLSKNQRHAMAASLDAALDIAPAARVVFSARTGEGRDELLDRINTFLIKPVAASI